MLIGVVSDTHGLLRPELLTSLAEVDHILHAGDVGDPAILTALACIAPVTAIRGNIDTHGPTSLLPSTELLEFAGTLVYMVHAREDIDISPKAADVSVVIFGHSHKPLIEHLEGVLYLNPGSAGPRRFSLPISCALLRIQSGKPQAELVSLQI